MKSLMILMESFLCGGCGIDGTTKENRKPVIYHFRKGKMLTLDYIDLAGGVKLQA